MEKLIEYYELPDGKIVKRFQGDDVYTFDPIRKVWEPDYSLTAEFAWDRPYGKPCENPRKTVDIGVDLPPFPSEKEFFVGNTVMIGAFPQKTLHDFSAIPWIVLETDGTTALCISKDCLLTSGYCDPQIAYGRLEALLWKNSLAREVCNHSFFDRAFSEEEKLKLKPRKVFSSLTEEVCIDRVFLLSESEVLHYFPSNAQRKARPTTYAIQKGAWLGWTDDTKAYTSWWILPEEIADGFGNAMIYPKAVFQTGDIQFHGRNAYHIDFVLRPCIQVQYKNAGDSGAY